MNIGFKPIAPNQLQTLFNCKTLQKTARNERNRTTQASSSQRRPAKQAGSADGHGNKPDRTNQAGSGNSQRQSTQQIETRDGKKRAGQDDAGKKQPETHTRNKRVAQPATWNRGRRSRCGPAYGNCVLSHQSTVKFIAV